MAIAWRRTCGSSAMDTSSRISRRDYTPSWWLASSFATAVLVGLTMITSPPCGKTHDSSWIVSWRKVPTHSGIGPGSSGDFYSRSSWVWMQCSPVPSLHQFQPKPAIAKLSLSLLLPQTQSRPPRPAKRHQQLLYRQQSLETPSPFQRELGDYFASTDLQGVKTGTLLTKSDLSGLRQGGRANIADDTGKTVAWLVNVIRAHAPGFDSMVRDQSKRNENAVTLAYWAQQNVGSSKTRHKFCTDHDIDPVGVPMTSQAIAALRLVAATVALVPSAFDQAAVQTPTGDMAAAIAAVPAVEK
ncbi:hypothetical protein SOG_gp1 [Marine RNA virus SOG]|uniref:hypothetical protein n=1 Tax=Marine RNA virus SOG TaxID=439014 RepID=UPI0001589CC5|nr:hypothetical protein SOG_gp1 [Marine RNA virus SOG]ABQ50596.1 unknown [Marine RNA virus SOG]